LAYTLEIVRNIAVGCWSVVGEMAPYLLLGFLVAGVLSVCVSPRWVERHLGRGRVGPVLKAALLGVPLPLCSCGVIPVAVSLRRHGATRAATASFLLSTPQTGVDSIAVTYALLGPVFAVFRPLAALFTGLFGGAAVELWGDHDRESTPADKPTSRPLSLWERVRVRASSRTEGDALTSCPSPDQRAPSEAWSVGARRGVTIGADSPSIANQKPSGNVILRALDYGFVALPRDIGGALLWGVVIAGAIAALTPPGTLSPYLGGGITAILLMMAVGIPLYVCATGSVPIAAGFIHLGASPGAALAFLVAGPGTNAATIAAVWKFMGRRAAIVYVATIAVVAVSGGLLLDWLFSLLNASVPELGMEHHHGAMHGVWATHLWAALLVGVMAVSYILSWRRKSVAAKASLAPEPSVPSEQVELTIRGMRCSHCTASVTRALSETPGVESAEVSLQPGRAVVKGIRLDPRRLAAVVAALGYTVEKASDSRPTA
jgi:uncharacterized protein